MAEPGHYQVQAAMTTKEGVVVSPVLKIRVAPPRGYDEEYLAQDYYTDAVGRVLAFDGSNVLASANDTLHEVVERLADLRVAGHARIALGRPRTRERLVLRLDDATSEQLQTAQGYGGGFEKVPAKPDGARQELTQALTAKPEVAAETLCHIDYKYYADLLTDFLAGQVKRQETARIQDTLYRTLAARQVKEEVLRAIDKRRRELGGGRAAAAGRSS